MEFDKDAFIIGEKIFLRPFKQNDLSTIMRLENHPDPRTTLFYNRPITTEEANEKIKKNLEDPNTIILIICIKDNGEPIGETALFRIDWVSRSAIYYIGIADKENWSKGYGSESTLLMVEYSFNTLNLNRIQLHVAVENEAAVKVYKKCGFKIEGTLRQAMYHDQKYIDFYVMGILKKEFVK